MVREVAWLPHPLLASRLGAEGTTPAVLVAAFVLELCRRHESLCSSREIRHHQGGRVPATTHGLPFNGGHGPGLPTLICALILIFGRDIAALSGRYASWRCSTRCWRTSWSSE